MKPRGPNSIPPKRAPNGKAERVYINLGRTGDAIASVPLCYLYWKETGKKAALMVAREFIGFLDGISYIVPEVWPGDWRDVLGARARARMMGYKEIVIPQVYGYDWPVPHTQPSFLLESWNRVGQLDKFYTTPLVFDRRNLEREKLLAEKLPTGLPIILVAADGTSSPFKYRDQMIQDLKTHLEGRANVVDLRDYRTDHFYDFIGLFDRAACLVTIDTGFGQLACASSVPVVALAASEPGPWYSSPRRPQHVAYVRYNDYPAKRQEVLDAVDGCVGKAKMPVIHHVWAGVYHPSEALTRQVIAKETWDREAKSYGYWKDCRFADSESSRSAKDIGETVALPFLHDMIDNVIETKQPVDEDIIMLTNADICLVTGLGREIADACKAHGSTYCHRWDFKRVLTHIERHQLVMGQWYVGCDLFAFTVKWWKENRSKLPPFILGRECWDWVFRELIKQTGGVETKKGIYHEKHASPWEMKRDLAGNLHNRSYARAWLRLANIPLAEIENEPYLEVTWPQKNSHPDRSLNLLADNTMASSVLSGGLETAALAL